MTRFNQHSFKDFTYFMADHRNCSLLHKLKAIEVLSIIASAVELI